VRQLSSTFKTFSAGLRIAVALLWLIPLLWIVLTALRSQQDSVAASLFPSEFTFSTFGDAWQAAPFGRYYLNTLIIAVGVIFVQLVTSVLAGYAFARMRFRFRNTLFLIYMLQMMIPLAALVVPNYITMKQLGQLDQLTGIMLPYFGSALGTFFLRQSFRSVPIEYEEAARIDGANLWTIIWRIYVPASRSAILAFLLISFSFHWDDFFWPLIVTSSDEVRPVSVGLALFTQSAESGAAWQLLAAGAILVSLPVLVLFALFQRQLIAGYAHGLR
jgi:sn-glycerol 3-phosphate transport system permease protein